jgi:hypothetical protein
MSLQEASERIGGVTPEWLRRDLLRREISGVRFGRQWRMTPSDVDAVVAAYHWEAAARPADPQGRQTARSPRRQAVSDRANPWGLTPRSLGYIRAPDAR